MKKIRSLMAAYLKKHTKHRSIQVTIAVAFTVVSLSTMIFLGVVLYMQFAKRTETIAIENSQKVVNQTAISLEDYLRNMRRISDAMYYSVIKDKDLATENLDSEMNLLYEANKDKLVSIACYTNEGVLEGAAPIATTKTGVNVTQQQWFVDAVGQLENFHFSNPHVQNLFDDSSYRYYWVISLSRTVELTRNGVSNLGVLLVDMNYSSMEQFLDKANEDSSGEYVYLMDRDGTIIYHPRQDLIQMGMEQETNLEAAASSEESYRETFDGETRLITLKTISYTGWKLVSVVPTKSFNIGTVGMKYLVIMVVALAMLAVILLNRTVSAWIARPLRLLNRSVEEWEAGNLEPDIYVGGSTEVEHLGRTLRSTVEQIRQLMQDIMVEQEEKRKSELDALQSQINPHFLYNTLDSIVWMITGERYDDAVYMVTQLASLFRISLSQGRTIIRVEEEIRHAQNYMNIQKIRYKNSFQVDFQIDPEILSGCIVKLVIQPLLENAIYYGMEFMDGDGEILVSGYRSGDGIYLEVQDNGLGMPEEAAARLLEENNHVPKHGSGVGLINVHKRIRLRFGAQYGLVVETHPDEGMTVRIHLPYIPYTEENQKLLEDGKYEEK